MTIFLTQQITTETTLPVKKTPFNFAFSANNSKTSLANPIFYYLSLNVSSVLSYYLKNKGVLTGYTVAMVIC